MGVLRSIQFNILFGFLPFVSFCHAGLDPHLMSVLCSSLFVIAQRCYVNETTGSSRPCAGTWGQVRK